MYRQTSRESGSSASKSSSPVIRARHFQARTHSGEPYSMRRMSKRSDPSRSLLLRTTRSLSRGATASTVLGGSDIRCQAMLSVLAATWLAMAPAKIAAPGLAVVNVKPEVAAFLSEHLARELKARGLAVVSAQEIQTLIGIERQRELKSCGDEGKASCMAELSGALGADAVLTGSVGRFEDAFQVHLSVVSALTGATLATYDGKAEGGDKVQ